MLEEKSIVLHCPHVMKEYTLEEIRRLADTNPAKLAEEYAAARHATADLAARARAGIAARSANPPTGKFQQWVQGYGQRYIHTGSSKPLVHMMLIIGATGVAVEWWAHHRHAHAHHEEKH